jgi:hypothetical protein
MTVLELKEKGEQRGNFGSCTFYLSIFKNIFTQCYEKLHERKTRKLSNFRRKTLESWPLFERERPKEKMSHEFEGIHFKLNRSAIHL